MDMQYSQNTNNQNINWDRQCEAKFTDPQVVELYQNGLISRAEADGFNIVANFDDNGSSGQIATK